MKSGFDKLAAPYRLLELLAFGRSLERARFMHVRALSDCRSFLILGDGDGRLLDRLAQAAPAACFDVVDLSQAMLARAGARVSRFGDGRFRFLQADALALRPEPSSYDAIVTAFFLDCFTDQQVASLLTALRPSLKPGGRWLFVDFDLPPGGWRRLRAQAWLALLYAFFRYSTGLEAGHLPDSKGLLGRTGLSCLMRTHLQHGLLVSAVYASPIQSGVHRTGPLPFRAKNS